MLAWPLYTNHVTMCIRHRHGTSLCLRHFSGRNKRGQLGLLCICDVILHTIVKIRIRHVTTDYEERASCSTVPHQRQKESSHVTERRQRKRTKKHRVLKLFWHIELFFNLERSLFFRLDNEGFLVSDNF